MGQFAGLTRAALNSLEQQLQTKENNRTIKVTSVAKQDWQYYIYYTCKSLVGGYDISTRALVSMEVLETTVTHLRIYH